MGKVFKRSLHAEVNAILKYNKFKKIKNLSLYVARLNSFHFGNSKPCEDCQKILILNNVQNIYYTDFINGENVLCKLKLVVN